MGEAARDQGSGVSVGPGVLGFVLLLRVMKMWNVLNVINGKCYIVCILPQRKKKARRS